MTNEEFIAEFFAEVGWVPGNRWADEVPGLLYNLSEDALYYMLSNPQDWEQYILDAAKNHLDTKVVEEHLLGIPPKKKKKKHE